MYAHLMLGLVFGLVVAVGAACGDSKVVPTPGPTPNDQELQGLTRTVMIGFSKAIQAEDFTEFYEMYPINSTSIISVSSLQRAYQHFIDGDVDLSSVETVDAVFDAPLTRERSDKVLVVEGHYPLSRGDLGFKIRYIYADETWRLHKFHATVPE
jgi:hypothetical protein